MKNKQKAPVVNPTTATVPLAKLSEDELDMVSGGINRFVWGGTGSFVCDKLFCPDEDLDA